MVFSSISFLFFFLPILFLIYFTIPQKYRNITLLIFSLIFYFFGEKWYVLLLIFSSTINYLIGKKIGKKKDKKFLLIGIIFDLGLLIYFKYTNFFIENFNGLLNLSIPSLKVILPLGISFFTFQNLSYLVDVYRKDVECERNLLDYITYIALFPQLVAGPIVRYRDIKDELLERKETIDNFAEGVMRFTIGLGKKVLIADTLYNSYTTIMASDLSLISYWLIALMFTFQIYYDFSGYSDMAIGLGKMFGFNFKENFNYPLVASSITDFWRRWHMSLSGFFKDYVYIPLGGNRCGKIRNIFNIFIVWSLTGFWHGASWNFLFWGLYFFLFLILEKFILKKHFKVGILSRVYTFLIVTISFVIFSVTDIGALGTFLKGLMGIGTELLNDETLYYLKNNIVIILISFIGMGPWLKKLIEKIKKGKLEKCLSVLEYIYFISILIMAISVLISSTFNPFIYFRF